MSMAAPTQQMRSSQRPVPLRGRNDLVVRRIEFQGVSHFVIKDPVGLTYHRLRSDQFRVLNLLDGKRSLETIRDELVREFPAISPTLNDAQALCADLHAKGLAYGIRPGQATARIRQKRKTQRQKILSGLMNILSLRLPGWDPDSLLGAMVPWTRWMYHPITAVIATMIVLSSWLMLAIQFQAFQAGLPAFHQFFGWPNLIFLWITLACSKVVHEFGHGLSCKMMGSECHEMGVMLLVGSPCLYCDVSDSWMLQNKWSRILIGAAGMLIEIVVSAFAIFFWWITSPGLFHYLCLNLFFVTTVTTVIFNANPLMRLDGYYMLSDFLEIPNMRNKADQLTRDWFAHLCLGIEPRHDPFMPQTNQHWFIFYAIASKLYSWVILGGILVFLYSVLKPYGLQSIGQSLAVFSLVGIVVQMSVNAYKILSAPREQPIRKWRLALTTLFLAGVVTCLGMIEIPFIQWAAFVIEPKDVRHVFTKVPGELVEMTVKPGDHVEAGQKLAVLHDPLLEDRERQLKLHLELKTKNLRYASVVDDRSERALAEESIISIREQLNELEERKKHLVVLAPISGTVVEPQREAEPTLQQQRAHLAGWTGTPLDQKNAGAYFGERTKLLSIAPDQRMNAILYLDQADRQDISIGLPVGLKFDHQSEKVYRGTISQIATAHSDYAPDTMSVRNGGLLATTSDREGRQQLQESAYQATIELDESPELMKSNLRGTARFMAVKRSVFGWLWRYVRRTFHFKM